MRKMNHFKLLAVISPPTSKPSIAPSPSLISNWLVLISSKLHEANSVIAHITANWSGFFGENNSNGWNAGSNNTTYYLLDNWIKATYTQSYTNALDPWKKLKIASEKNGTPEVFALAQILKISAWHKTLESFGPMPYSHAADATMNIPFDSEKEVYTAMFEELTAAIEELTEKAENGVNVMGAYDAVYAGDATKWVKYGNSLMLRLAMRVRFADAELAKKFATQAVNHSIGVMTAKDDAAQMSQGAGMTFRNNIEWLAGNYNEARMGSSIFSYLIFSMSISATESTNTTPCGFPIEIHVILYSFPSTIKMRVWERGAGETLACGTGACASAYASYLNKKTGKKVLVHLLGGDLQIEYNEEKDTIFMTGPATTVFDGEIDLTGIDD